MTFVAQKINEIKVGQIVRIRDWCESVSFVVMSLGESIAYLRVQGSGTVCRINRQLLKPEGVLCI